jgi:hypothetical protein
MADALIRLYDVGTILGTLYVRTKNSVGNMLSKNATLLLIKFHIIYVSTNDIYKISLIRVSF